MADNDFLNLSSFDDERLDMLPLITKERTQKFELLLHLIPNLKQHLIISGASGIGKTLLLDRLYDIDSEAWQCCFIQGSAELSFETIEAQLTKTMLRNKHVSLGGAFQNFQEQHKKIVLIIDDAGLLVSGLMTTLMDYAAAQPVLKLIFALTHEDRNNHRKTDRGLDNCYLLEIPTLSKRQCAYFLRHLAANPRAVPVISIDEKLLDKIYHDTKGIPARIIDAFNKLSRKNKNDYTKWFIALASLIILAIAINQGVRYFNAKKVENAPILPVEKIEPIEKPPVIQIEKPPIAPPELTVKPELPVKIEQDILIPEFQLDIEKGIVSAPPNPTVEKVPEPALVAEPEKPVEPVQSAPEPTIVSDEKNEKVTTPAEIIPVLAPPVISPEIVVPVITVPVAPVVVAPPATPAPVMPTIAFPKIEPAKGMKIQALPERPVIQAVPIAAPTVKVELIKKIDVQPAEKPIEKKVKAIEVPAQKLEPVTKIESKSAKEKLAVNHKKNKVETVAAPATGNYTLQLITLSSEVAIENFKKKHAALNKNFHVVKSNKAGQERFALMYGGFENTEQAAKARHTLPIELANAFPRKLNP